MEYEVDDNIPMPAVSQQKGRREKYPWTKLDEIGKSFFVPDGSIRQIRSTSLKAGKRLGCQYLITQEAAGVRVFRYA